MIAPARRRDTSRGRWYETVDGVFPSVTTILEALAKPALLPWAARTERELVMAACADLWEDASHVKPMSRTAFLATLENRIGKERAFRRESAKAMEIGTQTHALIEWNLRRELGQVVGPEPRISDKATWAFMSWQDWKDKTRLKVRAVEQVVWSATHKFAGTLDLWADVEIDGRSVPVVLDWKVSAKGPFIEWFLQNAAYVAALVEMGHVTPPVHGLIVRLPKLESDPDFEVVQLPADLQAEFLTTFLHVRHLWEAVHGWESQRRDGVVRGKGLSGDGLSPAAGPAPGQDPPRAVEGLPGSAPAPG